MSTRSHPLSIVEAATAALSRRRTLFRPTALPNRLLTVNPKRDTWVSFGRAFSTRRASAQLLPSRLTAKKSEVFRSLFSRLSVTRFAGHRRANPTARLKEIWEAPAFYRFRSDRQLVTTLEHPLLENISAGLGAHSRSETMHSGTASVPGLVGSFWHF
jgi:hypothetical protein